MREILFRGQTRRKGERVINVKGDPCESNWVYGGIFAPNTDGAFAVMYGVKGKNREARICCVDLEKFSVYRDTVGQFTGLTDKNGKKIFEGDIVTVFRKGQRMGNYVVKYCDNFCGFYLCNARGVTCFVLGIFYENELEVLGNIHDDPQLLECAKE